MLLAAVSHTPLPDIWNRMSLGQILRYAHAIPDVIALTNPLAAMTGNEDDTAGPPDASTPPATAKGQKPITDPAEIRSMINSFGIGRAP